MLLLMILSVRIHSASPVCLCVCVDKDNWVSLLQSHLYLSVSAIIFFSLPLLCIIHLFFVLTCLLFPSRLQTLFARFDEALNSGNMALSPSHGQCLFLVYFVTVAPDSENHRAQSCCQDVFTVYCIGCVFEKKSVCQWVLVRLLYRHVLLWLCLLPQAPVRGPNRINGLICVCDAVNFSGWARPEPKAAAAVSLSTRRMGCRSVSELCDHGKLVVLKTPLTAVFHFVVCACQNINVGALAL